MNTKQEANHYIVIRKQELVRATFAVRENLIELFVEFKDKYANYIVAKSKEGQDEINKTAKELAKYLALSFNNNDTLELCLLDENHERRGFIFIA